VGNWDADLSNAARRDTVIVPLRYALQGIGLLGDYAADATINLGVFVLGGTKEARNAKLATVSWIGCNAVTTLVKGIVDRDRPDYLQSSRWDSSFPSGHTSAYFALAMVYGTNTPGCSFHWPSSEPEWPILASILASTTRPTFWPEPPSVSV